MSEIRKRITRRNTYNLFVSMLLWYGIILFFASCDERNSPYEGVDNHFLPTSDPVVVNFTISELSFGENEVMIRQSSPALPEAEKSTSPLAPNGEYFTGAATEGVYVPITDDLYMYATVKEEEAPVKLRAAVPLAQGTIVRIVAYSEDAPNVFTRVSEADFEVTSGINLIPVDNPLMVKTGDYKFVACSFNRTTPLPSFGETLSVLSEDLLWGFTTETIAGVGSNIHITMGHLFSQVRLDADLDLASPVSSFSISQPAISAYNPELTVLTGTLTPDLTKAPVVFTQSSSLSSLLHWVSDSLHVYTHVSNPTGLTFANIELNGTIYPGPYYVNYSKPLKAGKTYTLLVTFLRMSSYADILYFANDGKLSVGRWADGMITLQNIAYFKFGGVVGFTALTGSTWTSSLIKFNPTSSTPSNYSNVAGIENRDTPLPSNNISASTYHNTSNIKAGKGDPCKLVGLTSATAQAMSSANTIGNYDSGWRLPSHTENINFVRTPVAGTTLLHSNAAYWGALGGQNGGWFPIPGNREMTTGRPRNQNPNGFLPVAGWYYMGNGNTYYFAGQNTLGNYMSNEVSSGGSGGNQASFFMLNFDASSVNPNALSSFGASTTVRCVKN